MDFYVFYAAWHSPKSNGLSFCLSQLIPLPTWLVNLVEQNALHLHGHIFQAELRANVFEAIEEEDRAIEKDEGLPPALLGSCNDRAKQLHNSPSGLVKYVLFWTYELFQQLLI